MAKTIAALYDDFNTANRVMEALVTTGFDRDQISVVANDTDRNYARQYKVEEYNPEDDVTAGEGAGVGAIAGGLIGLGAALIPGIGPIIAAGPVVAALLGAGVGAAAGAATGGITAALIDFGVDEETAHIYAEGVRRGGALVVAHVEDKNEDTAVNTMNKYNPIDVDKWAETWQSSGWSRFDERAEPYNAAQVTEQRTYVRGMDGGERRTTEKGDEVHAQVIEEEMKVGKRGTESGRIRVRTYVTEKPVSEQVRLREERVNVERRDVNRKATDADFIDEEKVYEFTERHEEPVVSKEARVVEEVVVNKDVDEHVETVSGTVRRQDVDVDRVSGSAYDRRDYNRFDQRFRTDYNKNFRSSGRDYETYYQPAYRYGYILAYDDRYRNVDDWSRVEPQARRSWEASDHDTPWNDVKDAVHRAWEDVKHSSM